MKFNHIYLWPLLLCLILVYSACDHDTDQFDGPFLVDRFGEFALLDGLTADRTTVDFSAGETVTFGARFNKQVNWVLTITGLETGAVKIIEGFSNELDGDNAVWAGRTTQLPFFNLEMCEVELTIPEEAGFSQTVTVDVTGNTTYEGSVFADFEEDYGSDLTFGNFEFELTANTGRQDNMPAGEGDFYYLFEGTDNVVANFFVGLINLNASINDETYVSFPTTVPENLYFNAFLYADGGPHGIAVIQFATDTNDNGVYDDGVDQTFQIEGDYPLSHTGWIHINHPMSDVGITEAQLQKIVAVRVLLISNLNSQPTPPLQVDFGIDYITFTQDAPLQF